SSAGGARSSSTTPCGLALGSRRRSPASKVRRSACTTRSLARGASPADLRLPDRAPARAEIGDRAAADDAGSVHLPERDLPARVLHHEVGMAGAVERAGADGLPARPRIGDRPAADDLIAVHFPNRDLPARILHQDVGLIIAIEIAGSDDAPAQP